MKKIKTLFVREFEGHGIKDIKPELTSEEFRWVLDGEGIATEKIDGACCAIIEGKFYKRYDAKKGKKPPVGAIPCDDPDPVTGHWPHWVAVDEKNPADRWFIEAKNNTNVEFEDGTYEAIGPHFNGNPYQLRYDILVRHGMAVIDVPRTFEGIRDYLQGNYIEGIVFWKDGEPKCKIKRSDFGFRWGAKREVKA